MLESSYASLMRALGMQEDREESQAPRVDFSGQSYYTQHKVLGCYPAMETLGWDLQPIL